MNKISIPARWTKGEYVSRSHRAFEIVDAYLPTPPKQILDIGCGYAYISQQFQKKYGTELWLLEGDFDSTAERTRKASWGDVDSMKFYLPLSELKQHWNNEAIEYNFVDANSINIDKDITFDFVSSWLSCGYHYPAETYRELITKHTNAQSVCIMDFRRKTLNKQQDIDVVHNLEAGNGKKEKLHFKFKE